MQYAYFKELPVGALFSLNGTRYSKRSSRTAALVEFDRWFYFGQKDLCVVGKYSRLAADYFTEKDLVTPGRFSSLEGKKGPVESGGFSHPAHGHIAGRNQTVPDGSTEVQWSSRK